MSSVVVGFQETAAEASDRNAKDKAIVKFIDGLSSEWLLECVLSMDQISGAWKNAEEIAIGTYHNYVMKRIDDDSRFTGVQFSEASKKANAESITNYLNDALDHLVQRSKSVWLPLAKEFVLAQEAQPAGAISRAPLTIWYRLRNGQDIHSYLDRLMEANRGDGSLWDEIKDSHSDIFIVAAAVAIQVKDWVAAERYAGLAVGSNKFEASGASSAMPDAQFIQALSMRFHLGQIDGHINASVPAGLARENLYQIKAIYEKAFDILQGLIIEHGKYRDPWNRLRLIRAHSELAALQLFLFASLSLASKQISQEVGQLYDLPAIFERAQTNLNSALRLGDASKDTIPGVKRLEQQYIFNIACSEVLNATLGSAKPRHDARDIADRLSEICRGLNKRFAPIVELSKSAFFALVRDTPETRGELAGFKEGDFVGELALDRHIAAKIVAKYRRDELL